MVYQRTGGPPPVDVKQVALLPIELPAGAPGAARVAGELLDQLTRELQASHAVIGPAALFRIGGDTWAAAKQAGADAVLTGKLVKLARRQHKGEHIVSGTDAQGNPLRRQAPYAALELELAITLELVALADRSLLARLQFARHYRQQEPPGETAVLRLVEQIPQSDLAARLREHANRGLPSARELEDALVQQCAREFRREVVPFRQTFQVQLLPGAGEANAQGLALMREKLPEQAAERFLEATESSARPDIAWYNLGVAYEQQQRHLDAEAAFRSALSVAERSLYAQALERVRKYGQ